MTEQEKYEFVSGKFLTCTADFDLFNRSESYWLEYIGNDTYIGRSDNILNRKIIIPPSQLVCFIDSDSIKIN